MLLYYGPYIGVVVGRSGNRFGYLFALTYFAYFLLVLTEAAYINVGKPEYILGFSYSGWATVMEALALSFLLTQRFEVEKEDVLQKESETQLRLMEKTLENERIVRNQNKMLEQKVEERTRDLQMEKQKSDDLLLNILPAETANELKLHGKALAKSFDMVTVMFTDFKDFTTVSEKVSAEVLVEEINTCFSTFDLILQKHNVEKIKTIGDAYLCVTGLPVSSSTHAEDMLNAALEIRDFMEKRKQEQTARGGFSFQIRLGMHTGPIVAGIVGLKKYAYDIWGDTVNFAARMEQNSEAGKINISGTTYELIKDKYNCSYRGKIPAKNKGELDMYFAERIGEMA
ncbi:MAG: hypothetical protein IPO27_12595 [Bacteroidetes bacterium]|nr:hypothetical protein [Bacteroidota bacterium]